VLVVSSSVSVVGSIPSMLQLVDLPVLYIPDLKLYMMSDSTCCWHHYSHISVLSVIQYNQWIVQYETPFPLL